MNREPITLFKMDVTRTMVRSGYNPIPHGRLAWLHRLLWRALVKMRAVGEVFDEKIEIIRLPCNADTALGKIMEAREGLFRAYREPKEVLIGPETFAELVKAPEARDYMQPFSLNSKAAMGRPDGGYRMFDLPVHVVPTMEGIIVR